MAGPGIRVAVIAGSRRPRRRALAVAEWVLTAPTPEGMALELIDLEAVALPALAEPTPPAFGEYTLPHTREWAALIDGFDAYVLVTPEYNHSTSAALKDALDHLYAEWHDKPVAFVGYGVDGGVRAVEHLRGVTAELGMAGLGTSVALNLFEDFDESGAPSVRERQTKQLAELLDALGRWARALAPLRSGPRASRDDSPSGSATYRAPRVGGGLRPTLSAASQSTRALEVAREFVRVIQDGLDRGDADAYDSGFAEDLLWGTPYGEVLAGYAPLNAAHRSMMTKPRPGHSRYELVQATMPTDGVVVTHVRRTSLLNDAIGTADFSEMALYVLVEHHGAWWLCAGHNTPVRDKP